MTVFKSKKVSAHQNLTWKQLSSMFNLQINFAESWDKLKGPLSRTGTVTQYVKSAYSMYFLIETYNF